MTYPNAGDMARIVVDPDQADGHSNIGKQVFCKAARDPQTVREAIILGKYGPIMEVQSLQPVWGKCNESQHVRILLNAGDRMVVPRSHLSRIDPPAGTDELYRAAPRTNSLTEASKSLEELLDIIEVLKQLEKHRAPSR